MGVTALGGYQKIRKDKNNMRQKRIIITGGPTNEPIDEVMKITNMSTGKYPIELGKLFFEAGYQVTMIMNKSSKGMMPSKLNPHTVWIDTTQEMMDALKHRKGRADFIIHAAAVGDYKPEFSFLLEDLADELFAKKDIIFSRNDILNILTNPDCKLDDSSKISSYQKNLTVKLGLTPKIIARLREWYPNAVIFGFKLLENVPDYELYEAAWDLCQNNKLDFVLANDLADLRRGKTTRYLVSHKLRNSIPLDTAEEVFNFIRTGLSTVCLLTDDGS